MWSFDPVVNDSFFVVPFDPKLFSSDESGFVLHEILVHGGEFDSEGAAWVCTDTLID